jgi:hypothetical protein
MRTLAGHPTDVSVPHRRSYPYPSHRMAGEETNLNDGQRAALGAVYDVFHEQAEWPSYSFVDRRLHKAQWKAEEVHASIPLEWAQFDRYHPRPSTIALTIAGITAIDDTAEELGLFVDAVRWLARSEAEYEPTSVTDAGQVSLTSEDFQRAPSLRCRDPSC